MNGMLWEQGERSVHRPWSCASQVSQLHGFTVSEFRLSLDINPPFYSPSFTKTASAGINNSQMRISQNKAHFHSFLFRLCSF